MRKWTVAMYEELLLADGAPARIARTPGAARDRAIAALSAAFPDKAAARAALGELGKDRRRRRQWSEEDLATLSELYPTTETRTVARRLRRTVPSVHMAAMLLGVRKTEEWLARERETGADRLRTHGVATRFQPGSAPHNKGRKGWDSGGRSRQFRFRKGHRPWTWKPIGTEKLDEDGYLVRKVSDTGHQPRDWRQVHRLKWEEANGRRVPRGHVVVFRDGDKKNLALENLELVSRVELMARNSIHNLPEDLRRVIRARAKLGRTIRKLRKAGE